ncbi:MAG: DUF749 family protein [Candidatus Thermoplasmatota archaeon]|jgi:hypothetical protein|nr:DUF749 family protein [Candidatus Thermoplasmatota archaeon]
MHVARLVAITELRSLTPDIRPFVEFKAMVEDREMDEKEVVAVLNIDTTTCYVPVFLKDPPTMDMLEKELAQQDAKLSSDSKEALSRHLKK